MEETFEEVIEILQGRLDALKGELEELETSYVEQTCQVYYPECVEQAYQAYYTELKVRINELGVVIAKINEILNLKKDG